MKPILSAQLPITFAGTDFSFDRLSYTCTRCGTKISGESVKGDVIRAIETVAEINGEAACTCGNRELFRFRVRSDATIQIFGAYGWQTYDVTRPETFTELVTSSLKNFFRKNRR